MLDGLESDRVALLSQFADSLRGDALAMGIAGGSVAFEPGHHGRTGGQGLPAPAESARAGRTGGIENLMADLGMSAVDAAVELAVENDAAADSGSNGYVDQARVLAASAPSGLGQGGGITVIFEGDADVEDIGQIFDRIRLAPSRKKVYFAKLATHGIHRACRSDADSGEFDAGALCRLAQHARDQFDSVGIMILIGRSLGSGEHFAVGVDHADGDLRPTDVDGTDHRDLPASVISIRLNENLDFTFDATVWGQPTAAKAGTLQAVYGTAEAAPFPFLVF